MGATIATIEREQEDFDAADNSKWKKRKKSRFTRKHNGLLSSIAHIRFCFIQKRFWVGIKKPTCLLGNRRTSAQLAMIDSLYIAIMEQLGECGIQKVEKMRAAIAKRRM